MSKDMDRYHALKALGLCIRCSHPATTGRVLCECCAEKNREVQRKSTLKYAKRVARKQARVGPRLKGLGQVSVQDRKHPESFYADPNPPSEAEIAKKAAVVYMLCAEARRQVTEFRSGHVFAEDV
jgi:hypothetical protein